MCALNFCFDVGIDRFPITYTGKSVVSVPDHRSLSELCLPFSHIEGTVGSEILKFCLDLQASVKKHAGKRTDYKQLLNMETVERV